MDHRGVDYACCVRGAHNFLCSSDMASCGWFSVILTPLPFLVPSKLNCPNVKMLIGARLCLSS